MVLVFGIAAVGQVYGQSGTFTLTDIPAKFNGKYACFYGGAEFGGVLGTTNPNTGDLTKLTMINNGVVVLPMWYESSGGMFRSLDFDYTITGCYIIFYDEPEAYLWYTYEELPRVIFERITLVSGSATMSIKDGDLKE